MRRRRFAAALLGLALVGAPPSGAQQLPPASQVLTLDQDRLFAESRFGRSVTARIEAETQALAAENRIIDTALEAEERDLTERRATTDPEVFRALGAAFDTKAEDLREAQKAKGRALNRSRDDERQQFSQAVGPVLAALMAEKGAVVILDDSAVVLSFREIDVTDEAIARLDAVLGDGTTPRDGVTTPVPQALPVPVPAPLVPQAPPPEPATPDPATQVPAPQP